MKADATAASAPDIGPHVLTDEGQNCHRRWRHGTMQVGGLVMRLRILLGFGLALLPLLSCSRNGSTGINICDGSAAYQLCNAACTTDGECGPALFCASN